MKAQKVSEMRQKICPFSIKYSLYAEDKVFGNPCACSGCAAWEFVDTSNSKEGEKTGICLRLQSIKEFLNDKQE